MQAGIFAKQASHLLSWAHYLCFLLCSCNASHWNPSLWLGARLLQNQRETEHLIAHWPFMQLPCKDTLFLVLEGSRSHARLWEPSYDPDQI